MKRESRTVDRSDQVDSLTQRHLPLVDILVDTRAELMDLAVASGLNVLQTMLEDDRTAICGQRCTVIQPPGDAKDSQCHRSEDGDHEAHRSSWRSA